MTQAKGWVTRQREQFELFAKSEHQEHRVLEKVIQESHGTQEKEFQVTPVVQEKEPPRNNNLCHKPTQAADTQKAEVIIYI